MPITDQPKRSRKLPQILIEEWGDTGYFLTKDGFTRVKDAEAWLKKHGNDFAHFRIITVIRVVTRETVTTSRIDLVDTKSMIEGYPNE